jgi:peptide/nickel transport system substrate-binding protein
MQNRFGLKDFILMVMVLGVGVFVFLGMLQRDREWDQVQDVKRNVEELEKHLARIESKLESGVAVAASPSGTAPSGASGARGSGRDESWARPGIPVEWQPAWDFTTAPASVAGHQVGGEFTETFEVQPAKLTPNIQTDVYGRRIIDVVVECLGSYDPKTLRMRGWLADAWQVDPKGLWFRVKIRDNARFSDGVPVTAEDIRWVYHDFVMNPQIDAERIRSTLDTFEKVEVISEKVVEFTFKEVYFANVDSALTLFVLPKHFYSKLQPSQINQGTGLLMGSGPYKLEKLDVANQWTPPDTVVLVRNEQYWGPRASLDRLRYKAITDEQARLTDYKGGQSDMINPSAPQFVANSQDPKFRAENQCLSWVNMRSLRAGIIWNCGPRNGVLTPFHDVRVRTAMTLLLNREQMIKDIWKGVGAVAQGFAGPDSPAFNKDIKPLPFDPERAKALLAEAGWKDRDGNRVLEDEQGREFTFQLTYFGGGEIAERIGTFIKDACTAVGIRVQLNQMDWSVGDPVRNRRDFDAMLMGWGANAPESDPKQIFHSDAIKNEGDNFGQWNSPEADKFIDLARREVDFAKRMEHWHDFERVMHEEQPYTWVRVAPYTRFVKGSVGNVNTYPKGLETWEFFRGSGNLLPAAAN